MQSIEAQICEGKDGYHEKPLVMNMTLGRLFSIFLKYDSIILNSEIMKLVPRHYVLQFSFHYL